MEKADLKKYVWRKKLLAFLREKNKNKKYFVR